MADSIFKNVRILDFTQVIAGSYATTIMGDMGAEVIKIEPPGNGDTLRLAGPMHMGHSGFFLHNNRNKKSISLDLKKREGVELIKKLVPHFDIITQNFKPGVMEKLGLGYEELSKIKEDIIYVSVSGYGHNNQNSHRAAYDNIIQCETGLAALNGLPEDGEQEGPPLRCPLSVSDYASGMYSAMAMASALYHRNLTGQGQNIDVAMYDSLISIMDNTFLIYDMKASKELNKRPEEDKNDTLKEMGLRSSGNRHPGAAPHGFYKTQDGHVAHMSLTNQMWHRLLKVIGRPDLIDSPQYQRLEQRKAAWREIDQIVEEWTSQRTTGEVMNIFEKNKLPCGKIRTIDEVFEDPHNKERGIFEEINHPQAGPIRVTNVPIKFSRTPTQIKAPSPDLGEHNQQVLQELLDYSTEEINQLHQEGILFGRGEKGLERTPWPTR